MMHVHRVAYMAHSGISDLGECDVSHLCHHTLCVCFEHLSLEPRAINNTRKITLALKIEGTEFKTRFFKIVIKTNLGPIYIFYTFFLTTKLFQKQSLSI